MIVELAIIALIFIFAAAAPFIFPTLMIDAVSYVLAKRPDDYDGWLYYGQLLAKAGRYEHAVHALVTAVTLRPDLSEAWEKLGDVYTILGESERATEAYRLAVDGDFPQF
ncbi:MAG: tetratricopeptide repeat protein [Candidatus Thorarchaeota archaeon]|jgi:cytochrome c-type biogenesis protein CcmH/NrfG